MAGETNTSFDGEVLARMSEGESLREICADLKSRGCPTEGRFRQRVIVDDPPGFATQYARARDLQMEAWADRIHAEATTPRMGVKTVEKPEGVEITTGDAVDRSRLAVDAMKWTLSKILPKKYGDKLALGGADDLGPVQLTWKSRSPTPQETKP